MARSCAVPTRGAPTPSARHLPITTPSASHPDLRPCSRRSPTIRGKENDILTSLPEVMAMRELPVPRPTFVLARGAYDAPTERVTPGTPRAIGDFPSNAAAEPAWTCALAPEPAPSADVAGDRQSLLGHVLRPRARRHAGGFRQSRQTAVSPAAARLAGDHVRRFGMEPEGAAEAHRAVGHVPAGFAARREAAGAGSGERVARRADRRIGWRPSRFATARSRPAGSWSAPSAGRASIRISRPDCGRRSPRGMRRGTSRGMGPISIAAASTRSGSGRRRRHPPSASTRPSGSSAPSTASAPIRRFSRWSC